MSATMQDNDLRMKARTALEAAGAMVSQYHSDGISLALKRVGEVNSLGIAPSSLGAVMVAAKSLGGKVDDPLTYFPLGSDNPPAEWRHWCWPSYTSIKGFEPGFWLYCKVILP